MNLAEAEGDFPVSPRFERVRRLGAGGMGVVWEAVDRERRQRVALKTLRTLTADGLLRFKNEFRALADLQHPNLVHLGELFCDADRWFFTMELVDGCDFLSWVRPGMGVEISLSRDEDAMPTHDLAASPPSPSLPAPPKGTLHVDRLRDSLGQLALGLYALHAAGKVHRDVKPSNILVTPDGRVVLVDFGVIAAAASKERHVVGTVGYMAPEQASLGTISPASDWYAVGVVLYQALTGRLPFSGAAEAVMAIKQQHDPPPPRMLDPSVPRDLDHLCSELMARDPAARPSGDEVLRLLHVSDGIEPLATAAGSELVGRRLELSVLGAALDEARLGHAVTVYVHGESGVGKSALVRHFAEDVAKSGVVLSGRCYERESVPFRAVDGVVDALARHLGELPPEDLHALMPRYVSSLAQVFPVLKRLPQVANAPEPSTDVMSPQERRRRLFTALRQLLGALADHSRLVIVIDDLQWADADSLAMLGALVRPPESPSLLLVATVRSSTGAGGGGRALPPLPGDVRHLPVTPLPDGDARELARRLLGRAPQETADAIAGEAAGHPLFIAELVRRRQSLAEGAGPVKLDDALGARIRHLAPEARRVLDVVALGGAPLSPSVAARAAALPLGDFMRVASGLRAANLVRTTALRGGEGVESYHDRVREAATALLDDEARRAGHARLATALHESPDPDPEALAVHYAEAGDAAKAAEFAAAAAGEAARVFAFDRAARLYRRALELRGDRAPSILRALGEALADAGRGREAARAFEEAAGASSVAGDAVDLRRRAAEQLLISGHIDEGLQVIDGVLAAVDMKLPATPKRALASLLWTRARVRLRGRKFVERSAETIDRAQLQRIDVCWSIAAGLGIVDIIRGADFQTRCLLLSLNAGEPYRVARALAMEGGYWSVEGGTTEREAREILDEAEALASRIAHPHAMGLVRMTRGIAAFCIGKFRDALRLGDDADATLRDQCTGVAWERASAQIVSMWSLFYMGELGELQRRAPALAREAAERGDLYALTNLRSSLLPLSLLAADAADAAMREIDESMSAWSQRDFTFQHYMALLAQVHVDLHRGDGKGALARIEAAWRPLERSLILRMQQSCLEAWHLRARATIAAADAASKPAALKAVARMEKEVAKGAMPWALGWCDLLSAAVLHGRGDVAAAIGKLDEAAAKLDANDLGLYALAARRRMGELVGGAEGRTHIAAADRQLAAQRIANPERWTAMLVPLFS